ncbi:helix-turn-helix transcriptional regulator [Clostridium sp. JS66]|uniref:helix-turn-helix domain-containing protein n=1 Tax=Clostridium sp. JS66 TaxID=3064705 RepID=UPI00298D77F9|nr:helix-turn-helix transcriptional regulator [Clostridium sp. JS66]WPC42923.1 helix-turn-helix transcriptional regulator [Clostridium sp. JS66]
MIGLEYVLNLYNMQHQELAEKLGIKKQNINLWIKKKQNISKKYLPILAEMFKIPEYMFQKEIDDIDKLVIQKEKLKMELNPEIIGYDLRLNVRGDVDIVDKPIYDIEEMNDLEFQIKKTQVIEDFRKITNNINDDIELQMLEQVALLIKGHKNKKILNFTIDAISHYYNVLPDWVGEGYDSDDFAEEFIELAKKYDK